MEKGRNAFAVNLGPVHTNAFSKVRVFVVIENASVDSRPHSRFGAFLNVHTIAFKNARMKLNSMYMLQTHAPMIVGHHFHFDAFSIVLTMTICMRFRFYPLSSAFSDRCVFDENAQHSSVDGRLKRVQMYVFSNENALLWTRP